MLTTTAEYKTAILAAQRDIKSKVDIYFDGEGNPPTQLDKDHIKSIHFLEEGQAEGETPLGRVSSNEITIALRNDEQQFVPTYEAGPYYEKLVPNVKVEPYLGLLVEGSYEWIPLGVFWTGDWNAPSNSIFATIVCHDRLYELGQEDVPQIPTMENQTQITILNTLFRAIGLDPAEYSIDATLTTVVPIAWFPEGKVLRALNVLAGAFNCTIAMTRDNILRVSSNRIVGSSVVTFADTDMVFDSEVPQETEEIYSKVSVKYKTPYIGSVVSLLKIEELTIPAAGITLDDLRFTESPVAFVAYIQLSEAPHISISSMTIGTWSMSLTVANVAGVAKTVNLEIFGHPIKTVEDEVTEQDATALALIGSKILPIDNYLVQTASAAGEHAQLILPIVSDATAYVSGGTRGDPSIEITDVMTIQNPTDKVGTIQIVPIRLNYWYTGGLRCAIRGIKKTAREGT